MMRLGVGDPVLQVGSLQRTVTRRSVWIAQCIDLGWWSWPRGPDRLAEPDRALVGGVRLYRLFNRRGEDLCSDRVAPSSRDCCTPLSVTTRTFRHARFVTAG